jgi:fructoselysine 6-kinase
MKEDHAIRVIGIGDNVVDNYIHIQQVFPGGNALNFAVYASMLGSNASYIGVFGTDFKAKHIQQTLVEIGVDISHCRSAEGPNGEALLTIEDGERTFISSNKGGVSKAVPLAFIFDDLEYLQTFSVVHTSAYSYMDDYLARLYPLEPLVSYDFSDDFDTEYALSLCPYIDFAFFSCSERTEKDTQALLERAVHQGCTLAVATRGPHDVIVFDGQAWFRQPPLAVKPVDTLGAGDAFSAAFLISFVGGSDGSDVQRASLIKESLLKAACFAAEICKLQGAFGHGQSY